jgi:16S rRNA (adenine1518-N6/adenine1519-N6)-dimethyltransferase
MRAKKSLGQHWLRDSATLDAIADYAEIGPNDTVLEIGPGLGTLTRVLAARAGRVVAVEFDSELAAGLRRHCEPSEAIHATTTSNMDCHGNKLSCNDVADSYVTIEIINADFLQFDLSKMPAGYRVVANIPYYITNPIIEKLLTAGNRPAVIVLLVQREVAERLAAGPGGMSVLSVMTQFYATVELGIVVPAEKFAPPPQVDSQVVILRPHEQPSNRHCEPSEAIHVTNSLATLDCRGNKLLRNDVDQKQFFRLVKAGFSQRRKKLRTAMAGGLNISVAEAEKLLHTANIDPNLRAQDLGLDDWCRLSL